MTIGEGFPIEYGWSIYAMLYYELCFVTTEKVDCEVILRSLQKYLEIV
ncbi:MAG: hypothetical protein V7K92_27195 [Nostoc sp.]